MSQPTTSESPTQPDPNRGRILAILLASLFMALMAVSIVNVTLPSIQQGLGATDTGLQWILSGYALSFGIVLVAAGRAGDLLGRERIFFMGITLFTVASLAAALAPSIIWLNIARVVMGVASGLINPQVAGLIQQHYRGVERARAFASFGAVVGVAVAVGPVIGGFLLGMFPVDIGWRTTLGINVPVGATIMVLAWRWMDLRAKRPWERDLDVDPVGAALLGTSVLTIMLPFMLASDHPVAWILLPTGLLLAWIWVMWERRYQARGHHPMVDLSLFKIRSYTLGSLMIGVYFMAATSTWVIQAQLVQQGFQESALTASLLSLPAAVLTAVSAQIGGRLVVRFGRWTVVMGLLIMLAGLTTTVIMTPLISNQTVPLWILAVTMAPIGIGGGLVTSPNQTLTLREVPVSQGGTAAAITQTGQRIGTAVGTAGMTGIYFHLLPAGAHVAADTTYTLIGVVLIFALIIALVDAIGTRRRQQNSRL
ncbi:MFS transporter [Kocuria sp.]|uniref:MFS transporter n=1 Tax=Kocuria sp. TaxID=1871328 RepID=UPI0026DF34C6|nr:MFS transporter [Kocuria sp.]MDO5619637.1 MFS transporter [Kocuria sp.]